MSRRIPDLTGAPRQHHQGVLRLFVFVSVLPPGLPERNDEQIIRGIVEFSQGIERFSTI